MSEGKVSASAPAPKDRTESEVASIIAATLPSLDKNLFNFTRAVWTCNVCLRTATNPVSFQCEDPLHIYCKGCVEKYELKRCYREKCNGGPPLLGVEDPQEDLPYLAAKLDEQEKKAKQSARFDWKEHQFNTDELLELLAPKQKNLERVQRELQEELKKQKEDEKQKAEQEAIDREAAAIEREYSALRDRRAQLDFEAEKAKLAASVPEAERKIRQAEEEKSTARQDLVWDRWKLDDEYGKLLILERQLNERQKTLENKRSEFNSKVSKVKQQALATNLLAVENARVELAAIIDEKQKGLVDLINARQKDFQLPELTLTALTFGDYDAMCTRIMLNTCQIVSLTLDDAMLEDSHVRMLARALGDGPTAAPKLESISLRGNLFGEVGACSLLEAISYSPYTLPPNFRSLELDDNGGRLSAANQEVIAQTLKMSNQVKKVFAAPKFTEATFVNLFEHLIFVRQHVLVKIDVAWGLIEA